jgi:hypothetical protein
MAAIKYTNIYHSKALQNIPKLWLLVWKHTVWQPCLEKRFSKIISKFFTQRPTRKDVFKKASIVCLHSVHGVADTPVNHGSKVLLQTHRKIINLPATQGCQTLYKSQFG